MRETLMVVVVVGVLIVALVSGVFTRAGGGENSAAAATAATSTPGTIEATSTEPTIEATSTEPTLEATPTPTEPPQVVTPTPVGLQEGPSVDVVEVTDSSALVIFTDTTEHSKFSWFSAPCEWVPISERYQLLGLRPGVWYWVRLYNNRECYDLQHWVKFRTLPRPGE
jgi:hypothetical protein